MPNFAELVLTADTRGLKKGEVGLDRIVTASGKAEKGAGKAGKAFGAMSGKLAGLGLAVAAAFGARQFISTISDFETSMSKVGAITRATGLELNALRQIALELGSTTEFSAAQAADGLKFLGMAGFSAAESIAAIPAVLDLATASAMGLAEAADATSNIMSAFGIAADDAGSVADVLASAASRANTDVAQLGDAMKFVGPVASSLGMSMSDAAAAIGVLSDAGIQGGMAGTSLRQVLSGLISPTGGAKDAIRGLGLTLAEVNPEAHSLTEIIDKFALAGIGAADALAILGDRGGPALLALTGQATSLRKLTDELQDVDGAAGEMAATMRDNLGGDIKGLMSSVQGLILAVGDAGLTTVLRGVVKVLTMVTRGVGAFVNAIGRVIDWTGRAARGVVGLGSSQYDMGLAVDAVTLAMRDEGVQIAALHNLMKPGTQMSLEAATAKLAEARATRENVKAKQEEKRQSAMESSRYQMLSRGVGIHEAVLAARAASASADELRQMNDAISHGKTLVQEFLEAAAPVSDEFLKASRNVDEISAAIATAKGEIVTFGDLTAEVIPIGERIADLFGTYPGILGDGAGGASRLGAMLQSAAKSAMVLANSLGTALAKLGALLAKLPGVGAGFGALGAMVGAIGGSDAFAGLRKTLSNVGAVVGLQWESVMRRVHAPGFGDTSSSGGGGRSGASEAQREANNLKREGTRLTDSLRTAQEKYNDEMGDAADLLKASAISTETYQRQISTLTDEFENSRPFVQEWKDSLLDAAMGGENAFDGLKKSIKRAAYEMLLFNTGPLADLFSKSSGSGGWLSGLFGGSSSSNKSSSSSGGGFFSNLISSIFGSANGNVFSGGSHVTAYANGGVVNSPTLFPMTGGQTGLMGEAGPEAIMPLTRIGGKLGVQAVGGGSSHSTININIDGANGDQHVISLVKQGVSAGMKMVNDSLPARFNEIANDPTVRYG